MIKIFVFILLHFYAFTLLAQPIYANEPTNLYLKTTGNQVDIYLYPTTPISTFAIKLDIKNSDVVDASGKPLDELTLDPKFLASSNWLIPFQKVVRKDGQVWIEIAGATLATSGWQPSQETLLTSFAIKTSNSDTELTFDTKLTVMTSKSDSTNVTVLPTSTYTLSTKKPNLFDRIVSFFRRMIQ